jgi:hypothetical protein
MDPYRDPQIVRNRIAELHDQAERTDLALAIGRPAAHAAYSSRTARRPAAGPPLAPGDAPGFVPDTGRGRTVATVQARPGRSGQAHAKGPGCMPPAAPGTPKSAPQGRRTPKQQHPRRTADLAHQLRTGPSHWA